MTAGGFAQAVAGMAAFVGLGVLLSSARRRIDWRLVAAIVLQFVICVLLLRVPVAAAGLAFVGRGVDAVTDATRARTTFLFGLAAVEAPFAVAAPGALVTFAFRLLPIVIVMSAELSALLWHWRVLPLLVRALAGLFERTLGTRGPAGLAATAEIFAGPVESPLLVGDRTSGRSSALRAAAAHDRRTRDDRGVHHGPLAAMLGPFFDEALGHLLTKSVMSVPASILFAHLLLPEDPRDPPVVVPPRLYTGSMDALTGGRRTASASTWV